MESRIFTSPFHPRQEELPLVLPVFPLSGILFLPWMRLPLNVFEPRYLSLVSDALGLGRMIGIIQPVDEELGNDLLPPLYTVGCVGRISTFSETQDGCFIVTLTGCIRFRVVQELQKHRAYRLIEPDYSLYLDDLVPPSAALIDRARLIHAVTDVLEQPNSPLTPQTLEALGDSDLVNTIAMAVPMEPNERQALLEAPDIVARSEILLTILSMARYSHTFRAKNQ